jgi:hypothetical protein
MVKYTISYREIYKKKILNVDVSNPIAKLNTVNVLEMDKHVVSNVTVDSAETRKIEKIYHLIKILDVNASNLGARKNIANVFKMEKNVELYVNAQIVPMEKIEQYTQLNQ